MTRFLSAFGKAASFTARGAAVTFGSTVFSCFAACNIEKGANRMILKYYPHKLVDVEAASGITKEELDFVKFTYGGDIVVAADQKINESSSTNLTTTEVEDAEFLFRYDTHDNSIENASRYRNAQHKTRTINLTESDSSEEKEQEKSAVNRFWTEGEEAATKALSIIPIIVPRQEILACSMTA